MAAPDFGGATIDPVVFYTTPGSSCTAQPSNSVTLPIATGTGTISYAVADLPAGFSFDANTRTLTGDPATITESLGGLAYTATDSADGRTARLVVRWRVVDERTVLQKLYRLTRGDTWTNKSGGWANPITATCLGDLHGVTLDSATGRVQRLLLSGNNLTGPIPPELGTLTALTILHLHKNQLTGPIPDLSRLTSLTTLWLHENQLTGRIPPLPASLTTLWLHDNRLSGPIPNTLPTSLMILWLHDNRLNGPIPDLSTLTSLKELWLNGNFLTGEIPTKPDPNDNTRQVLALPPSLLQLSLHDNQLSGEIPDLSSLTSLRELTLYDNSLRGPIPPLPASLTTLALQNNQLSGEIPDLSSLTSLTQLHLYNNRLSGEIPDLSSLTSLTHLYLHNNLLSGPIPNTLPTSLMILWLHDNRLNGEIPDLSSLSKLIHLFLHNNLLSGPIPNTLPTSLMILWVHDNRLNGPIPDLSALTSLAHIYLHTNRLGTHADGTVTDISGLAAKLPTSLTQLYLHNSGLSGEIPDLSSLTGLSHLDLSDNQLTGPIPDLSLGANAVLYLHNNQLSGAVPALASAGSTVLRLSLYGNPDLYGYPAAFDTRSTLLLVAPGDGTAVCLPSTQGGTDCTVPTLVDNLRVQATSTRLKFSWEPNPADPTPSGYTPTYWAAGVGWRPAPPATATTPAIRGTTAIIHGLTPGATYLLLVRTADSSTTPQLYYVATTRLDDDDTQDPPPPQDPPPRDPPGGSVGGGGGGGGAPRDPVEPANRAPETAEEIEAATLAAGAALEIDLSDAFDDPDGDALEYMAESSDESVATVEVDGDTLTVRALGRGTAEITVTATDADGETVTQTFEVTVTEPEAAWYLPPASDPVRQGFVRVLNHSDAAGEATVTATDDAGRTYEPLMLSLEPRQAAHFNTTDLESGNAAKGLTGATGMGTGGWRLAIESETLDIEALAYIRTTDGFVTGMNAVAPREDGALVVPFFNPGSNVDQMSLLRLVNPGTEAAEATVTGTDDMGLSPGSPVLLTLPAGSSCTVDAAQLESGSGLACGAPQDGLGDGAGKWRLAVASDARLVAMSLLSSPAGHLTNLSGKAAADAEDMWHVDLLPAASDPLGRQGFVRVVNRSAVAGAVTIVAHDDSDTPYETLRLSLGAGETAHFNSDDLELGNAAKGLTGSTGSGMGTWRLALSGDDIEFEANAYIRTTEGFLTAMNETAPAAEAVRRVAFFNPGSNADQVSVLRLVNRSSSAAEVSIDGTDDLGLRPGATVRVLVPATDAVELTAAELESGEADAIESGALGDGTGKWRLRVESDGVAAVLSLLSSPSGHLTNLSHADGERGLGELPAALLPAPAPVTLERAGDSHIRGRWSAVADARYDVDLLRDGVRQEDRSLTRARSTSFRWLTTRAGRYAIRARSVNADRVPGPWSALSDEVVID